MYDDDNSGIINKNNLMNCANELNIEITESEIEEMIEMANQNNPKSKKKGGVSIEDFI